jgi:hypothetical protein
MHRLCRCRGDGNVPCGSIMALGVVMLVVLYIDIRRVFTG